MSTSTLGNWNVWWTIYIWKEKSGSEERDEIVEIFEIESTPQKTPPKSKILVSSVRSGLEIWYVIPFLGLQDPEIFLFKVTLRSSKANITASLIFCPITVLKHAASRMAWWHGDMVGQFAFRCGSPDTPHPQKNRHGKWFVVSTWFNRWVEWNRISFPET